MLNAPASPQVLTSTDDELIKITRVPITAKMDLDCVLYLSTMYDNYIIYMYVSSLQLGDSEGGVSRLPCMC